MQMTIALSEEWKKIRGYERCEVSSLGRVRGSSGRILQTQKINSGYLIVHLCEFGVRSARTVHRLVAEAFIPADFCKPHVNHRNGDKTDNKKANLEWCTPDENCQHAYDTGLREPPRFAVVGVSLLDGPEVRFLSQRDAEIALSKPKKQSSAIAHCFSGKKKSAYGYVRRRDDAVA